MYQKLGLPEVERTHLESKLPSVRTYREKEKWDERGTLLGVEQQRLDGYYLCPYGPVRGRQRY